MNGDDIITVSDEDTRPEPSSKTFSMGSGLKKNEESSKPANNWAFMMQRPQSSSKKEAKSKVGSAKKAKEVKPVKRPAVETKGNVVTEEKVTKRPKVEDEVTSTAEKKGKIVKEVKITKKPKIDDEDRPTTSTAVDEATSSEVESLIAKNTGIVSAVHPLQLKENVDSVLKKVFLHSDFKSKLQSQAVHAVSERNTDVFVSFPTGAGKSLVYQLPSLLYGGVSIVVSPLIALITDQVAACQKRGIACESLNSKLTLEEKRRIHEDLRSPVPRIKLLYMTPEGLATDFIQSMIKKLYDRNLLSFFIVDEAHCVTHWGHDFRPDYLKLSALRTLAPLVPWVALTATANAKAQEDIVKQLGLERVRMFKASTYRHNLFYDVVMKDLVVGSAEDHMFRFLQRVLKMNKKDKAAGKEKKEGKNPADKKRWKGSGIVYCRTRDECDQMVASLVRAGMPALVYHAGLSTKIRDDVQEKWMRNEVPVIAATIAFGMGIDKPDVRFVVHWTTPQNLASYYQESGRAGRDGKRSYCRVYYNKGDRNFLNFLVSRDLGQLKSKNISAEAKDEQTKAIKMGFEAMLDFCEKAQCRHQMLGKFFGDDVAACKSNCDYCSHPEEVDKSVTNYHAQLETRTFRGKPRGSGGDDGEMYGGGKSGMNEDGSSSRYEDAAERVEREEQNRIRGLMQAEFARRRKLNDSSSSPSSFSSNQPGNTGPTLVLAPDAKTVPKLPLEKREGVLNTIREALDANGAIFSAFQAANANIPAAAQLEKALYDCCTTTTTYAHKAASKVAEIKKATKESKKYSVPTPPSNGFMSAAQLMP